MQIDHVNHVTNQVTDDDELCVKHRMYQLVHSQQIVASVGEVAKKQHYRERQTQSISHTAQARALIQSSVRVVHIFNVFRFHIERLFFEHGIMILNNVSDSIVDFGEFEVHV